MKTERNSLESAPQKQAPLDTSEQKYLQGMVQISTSDAQCYEEHSKLSKEGMVPSLDFSSAKDKVRKQ